MSVLEDLLNPISVSVFFKKIYETAVLKTVVHNRSFKDLFSSEVLEEYLFTSRAWQVSDSEEKAGLTVIKSPNNFFVPDVSNHEQVLEFFAKGYTLRLRSAHTRHLPLSKFCKQLSKDLNCDVKANIYITPANSRAFIKHYDKQDLFIIQSEGEKTWFIDEKPEFILPFQEEEFYLHNKKTEVKNIKENEYKLFEGDVVYIPRGFSHYAETNNKHSIHITVSISPMTWYQLISALVLSSAIELKDLRKTIPLRLLESKNISLLDKKLNEVLKSTSEEFDIDGAMRFLYSRSNSLQPQKNINALLNIEKLTLTSTINMYQSLDIEWNFDSNDLWVSATGRMIRAPKEFAKFLDFIKKNNSFKVIDIPNSLENQEKLIFCKWLILQRFAEFF